MPTRRRSVGGKGPHPGFRCERRILEIENPTSPPGLRCQSGTRASSSAPFRGREAQNSQFSFARSNRMALSLRFWIESWIVLFIRSIPVAHFGKPSPNIPIENQFGPRDRFSASRFPLDCHLARCEDTFSGRSGKPGVRLRREMRGEGSAARRAAQHFRTHPPPSTGPHGLFSRHPPVRWRQCPAQVRAAPALRREHRLDSNSRGATDVSRSAHSAMIRPRRERRARARRDASVGSDDPGLTNTPFATSAGLPPRARTSRPRATSRCVPGSCALFGDIWRHVGSRN